MILFVQQSENAVELAGGNCASIYTSSFKVFKLALTALVGDTTVTKSMWIHIENHAWILEYIVSFFRKRTSFSKHKQYFCILNHIPDFLVRHGEPTKWIVEIGTFYLREQLLSTCHPFPGHMQGATVLSVVPKYHLLVRLDCLDYLYPDTGY